ncbi:amidohydrolase/deacetylase family metallohydrolase [Brevibacillus migulae]|uniref:amidohydrolase/deacetylase family metallohydrolase n=1 Tax=Brevibacillus migulae TaxID=1644114 RepID=UPI00106E252D|nr:amidohydrolase/deacetylase family metallohydrolase [Brevibacillus migulae]
MKADILVKNGRVIDPSMGLFGMYDLAITKGKIAAVVQQGNLPVDFPAEQVLDVSGCIVTPGLIDLHTHVFEEDTALGIFADRVGVEQGVTTVVDAGSAGAFTFEAFLAKSVKPAITQVLAFLNISGDGLCRGLSELSDLSRLAPVESAELIKHFPEIRGIKVRMSASVVKNSGIEPLKMARKLSDEVNLPLMVHIGNAPPALPVILDLLKEGDVVTHAFHGKKGGILDEEGRPIPAVTSALNRGVLLDVGHGTSSFSFEILRQAMKEGILPFSISSDIYRQNIEGPVYSQVTTMNKCLAVGLPLEKVIEAATIAPASVLGLADEIGTLKQGTIADVTVLKLEQSPAALTDSENMQIASDYTLLPQYTIKAGKVLKCL